MTVTPFSIPQLSESTISIVSTLATHPTNRQIRSIRQIPAFLPIGALGNANVPLNIIDGYSYQYMDATDNFLTLEDNFNSANTGEFSNITVAGDYEIGKGVSAFYADILPSSVNDWNVAITSVSMGSVMVQSVVSITPLPIIIDDAFPFVINGCLTATDLPVDGAISLIGGENGFGAYQMFFNRYDGATGVLITGPLFDDLAEFQFFGFDNFDLTLRFNGQDNWLLASPVSNGLVTIDAVTSMYFKLGLDCAGTASTDFCIGASDSAFYFQVTMPDTSIAVAEVLIDLSGFNLITLSGISGTLINFGFNPLSGNYYALTENAGNRQFQFVSLGPPLPTSPASTSLKISDAIQLPCYNPCIPHALKVS